MTLITLNLCVAVLSITPFTVVFAGMSDEAELSLDSLSVVGETVEEDIELPPPFVIELPDGRKVCREIVGAHLVGDVLHAQVETTIQSPSIGGIDNITPSPLSSNVPFGHQRVHCTFDTADVVGPSLTSLAETFREFKIGETLDLHPQMYVIV